VSSHWLLSFLRAKPAGAAARSGRMLRIALSRHDFGDTRADLRHDPAELVPENVACLHLHHVAVIQVQIAAAADGAAGHLKDHVARIHDFGFVGGGFEGVRSGEKVGEGWAYILMATEFLPCQVSAFIGTLVSAYFSKSTAGFETPAGGDGGVVAAADDLFGEVGGEVHGHCFCIWAMFL
jgi:hypothetical protein